MLFSKKKTPETTDDVSAAPAPDAGGSKKMTRSEAKRAKDSLRLVIDETEPGAALDLIKTNANWILPTGHGVVLALPVDASVDNGGIGGLGQVSAKGDEAKGSILERIQADSIQVLETADMLDNNILGVIPTQQTLGPDGMGEYTLFDRAIFLLTTVKAAPDGSLLVDPIYESDEDIIEGDTATVTLAQAQAVTSGSITLSSLIPGMWARLGGTTERPAFVLAPDDTDDEEVAQSVPTSTPAPAPPAPSAVASASTSEQIENLPDYDPDEPEEPMEDDLPTADEGLYDDDDQDVDPFADLDVASAQSVASVSAPVADDADAASDAAEAVPAEAVPVTDDRVFDTTSVKETMARRFLDTDLDLVVDMTPFETVFGYEEDTPIGFATDHLSDGWLDSQMKLLSQQANDDLAALRKRDIAELRERFFSLISGSGVEIAAQMSVEEGADTMWARTIAEAEASAEALRTNLVTHAEKQRAALVEEYEREREKFARAEAEQASSRYDDRHKAGLTRRLSEIEPGLRAEIDEDLSMRRRGILDARRKAAQAVYDAVITQAMDALIERRSQQVDNETALMERYRAQMQDFLDENRKEDIARSQALSEELSRHNIVEEERAAHAAREKDLHARIDAEQLKAQEALALAKREADDAVARVRADYERQLDDVRSQVKTANERTQDMATQVEYVRTSTTKQFEAQVEALETDKQALIAQMEREGLATKRANSLYIALAVLVALAFLAVGVIAGLLLHSSVTGVQDGATVLPWIGQHVSSTLSLGGSVGV